MTYIKAGQDSPYRTIVWGGWAAIFMTIVAFFSAQLAGGMFAGIIGGVLGKDEAFYDETLFTFIFICFSELLMIALVIAFIQHRKGLLSMLGLRLPRLADGGWALIGFGAYFAAYIIVVIAISQLVPSLDLDQEQDVGFNNVISNVDLMLTFASLVIIVPFAEEFLFRGFLYSGLRKSLALVPAVIVTSLIFAIGHLPTGVGGLLWIGALDTFVLSVVLCSLREKTGSIWAGVLVHAIKNSIAFIALYIVS